MVRLRLAVLTVALAWASVAGAQTRTYFGFSIGLNDAPPPPRIYAYEPAPMQVIPGTSVYVVNTDSDYDMFRYGPYFYVMNDGYWYRARRYGGPFYAIDVRRVPEPILALPASHWRHRDWWNANSNWRGRDWRDRRYYRNRDYDRGDWGRDRDWDRDH